MPRRRLQRLAAQFIAASQERILDCGEGVRLQAFHARPAKPCGRTAILLHGWEGSADSYYMVSLGHSLFAAGVEVVRLNLRDHGATHHLNEGIFHSCRLDEVCGAVAALRGHTLAAPWLIGFSLGGNFMLRVATSQHPQVPQLAGVVAVSPVLHPESAMRAMETGWPIYQRYFVHKWHRSLARKRTLWPTGLIDEDIFRQRNLRRMTAAMVARHTSFAHIDHYLDGYAVTGDRLATLAAPAVVLASRDDPIIPAVDLPRLAANTQLRVVTTEHGGHMGFMQSPFSPSWINAFVAREMGVAAGPPSGG